jgi:UDP-N-acetylglucosamine enolpyruvyl transferase
MERFRVVGGTSLRGEVSVVGAKNSALKLMAGALLAVGRTRLTNVPAILDVTIMAELLRRLGCIVDYDAASGVVEIDVPDRIGHRRLRAGSGAASLDLRSWPAGGPVRQGGCGGPRR